MPVILSLVDALVFFIGAVCKVFTWLLVIRIMLSWVGVSPYTHFNDLLAAIYQATDIILRPFARLPLRVGMIDFSPLLAMYLLYVIPGLAATLLYGLVRGFH